MRTSRADIHGRLPADPKRPGRIIDERNSAILDDPGYIPPLRYETNTNEDTPRAVGWREVTFEQLPHMIGVALKWYQSLHKPYGNGSDPFLVYFPYAWNIIYTSRLEELIGKKVYNTTTNVVYSIKSIRRNEGGVVQLEGPTAPGVLDKLLFDTSDAARLLVNYVAGYPNTEDGASYFSEDELKARTEAPWTDTVSYRLLKAEPAGVKGFFEGTRDLSFRQIENINDETGQYRRSTQRVDSEFQFDCWTQSNERSNLLASWFRQAMKRIIPVLGVNGLMAGIWQGQLADRHVTKWRNDILANSHRYRFRTSEVEVVPEDEIRAIEISASVSYDDDAELVTNT